MAEVAGLVLGVIPIVLEALKQYETLYTLCKRFKKCKNGIEELLHCLQTQKVIFTNETRLLLATVLGSEDAKAMVNDVEHPLWHDVATSIRIDSLLGDSKDAFTSTGQEIGRKMKRFEDELQKIQVDDHQSQSFQDKAWRKEVRKRFKYVFSESKILGIAESIAKLTKKYRTLRSQIQELANSKPEPANSSCSIKTALERLTTTQAAARRVYEVLAAACKLHTKHHAHFGLKSQYNNSTVGTEIKFQIAYRHLSRQQAPASNDVIWFVIESILIGTISTIPPSIQPRSSSQAVKRPPSPTLICIQDTIQSQKKRVRFQSPTPEPALICSPSTVATLSSPTLPDLGTTTDFCTQLRACCKNNHTNGTCVGWLRSSSQWKHRVYQSKGPMEQTVQKGSRTLASLLASARKNHHAYQGLPMLQRLHLAKLLTTAILNFHATPWMQSCWRSDDIFLYDFDLSDTSYPTREPDAFVEVPVDQTIRITSHQSPNGLAPFVRNSNLFNLAVMLLELAFERPLRDMIDPSDAKPGLPAITIDYYAAMRLSKEVSTYLGPRYGHIVEQCLFCAFGHGTDLSDPALQSAIQRDVVSELDRLATGFQNLLIA